MTALGIAEITLESRDPAVLASFYADVFGLSELTRKHDRIWLRVGERCRLGIWSPGPKEHRDRGGRHVHFAFSVGPADLEALAERLRSRGLEVEGPVEHHGGDRSLYVEDPEGNVVGAWDFFEAAEGARTGTDALAGANNGA